MNEKSRRVLLRVHRNFYTKVFPDFIAELGRELGGCDSVLDVGCGSNSPLKNFSGRFYSEGVDAFLPSIEKSKEKGIHNRYHKMDVLDIGNKFGGNSFDCVVALDLIEHLGKKDGMKLISKMENIAGKKVIIFTPNGFVRQEEYDGNRHQVHKSGWSVHEMKKMGYDVIGINGLKSLRDEFARIRLHPKFFWWVVSDITQKFVRNSPEKAFQILCVKEKQG